MKNTFLGMAAVMVLAMAVDMGSAHAGTALAADYVQFKPMSQVVTEGVRDCRVGAGSNVPMITWGADIVTLYANGNNLETQTGSLMANNGLNVKLKREDVFTNQVEAYLRCDTPYLRGTLGMLNLAVDVTEKDPRTKMVTVYQHSWSAGGDALVARETIKNPEDLKGKTVAVQNYGPHVDYLFKVLEDAGLQPTDVNIVWTRDLVGFDSDSTPGVALLDDANVDAAMVIIPDALVLTSGGAVGTGAEGSVPGGHILLSTKSASRIITDVYAVRADYLKANRGEVQQFVQALFQAEEQVRTLVREKDSRGNDYDAMITAAATYLLDAPTATVDAEGMWSDAETTGYTGNKKFFNDASYPRRFDRVNEEVQTAYTTAGLITAAAPLEQAAWDYGLLAAGVTQTAEVSTPKFNNAALTTAVTNKAASGGLADDTLFTFQINFQPNQKDFPIELYADSFNQVVDLAATYGGAVITVEGHSDPLNYLKKKQGGAGTAVLNRIWQSARNLSMARANAVRDAIINLAEQNGFTMDPSQFVTIGMGISNPASGSCGEDPCAPKTKAEWLGNMRVVFRIVNIEGESSTFELLQ